MGKSGGISYSFDNPRHALVSWGMRKTMKLKLDTAVMSIKRLLAAKAKLAAEDSTKANSLGFTQDGPVLTLVKGDFTYRWFGASGMLSYGGHGDIKDSHLNDDQKQALMAAFGSVVDAELEETCPDEVADAVREIESWLPTLTKHGYKGSISGEKVKLTKTSKDVQVTPETSNATGETFNPTVEADETPESE